MEDERFSGSDGEVGDNRWGGGGLHNPFRLQKGSWECCMSQTVWKLMDEEDDLETSDFASRTL